MSLKDLTIVPWDHRYAVTKDGRVFSRARSKKWKQLSLFKRKKESDYLSVPLGHGNVWFVHRLIAAVFLGSCPEGLQIRHLDGNPQNNKIKNLRYGTPKENAEDRHKHGRTNRGEDKWCATLTATQVIKIRKLYDNGTPVREIAKNYSATLSAVSQAAYRSSWRWLP